MRLSRIGVVVVGLAMLPLVRAQAQARAPTTVEPLQLGARLEVQFVGDSTWQRTTLVRIGDCFAVALEAKRSSEGREAVPAGGSFFASSVAKVHRVRVLEAEGTPELSPERLAALRQCGTTNPAPERSN